MPFDSRTLYRWMIILFLLAAALRVGWVSHRFAGDQQWGEMAYPDEEAYVNVARSLAAGEGLRDEFGYRATYMPAYPGFLSIFSDLPKPWLWARITQALLGALAAPLAFLLAWEWARLSRAGLSFQHFGIKEDGIAMLAGLAVCFDPFLIFFSGLLLTEVLFTVTLLLAWLFVLPMSRPTIRLRPSQAVAAGICLWGSIMIRPSAAILVILVPLAVIICRFFKRDSIMAAFVMVAVVFLGLFPWAFRNRLVLDEWVWLTTRGGISLYDGLQQGATGASDLAHTKTMPAVQELNELQWNRFFRNRALGMLRNDPWRVAELAWTKFLRTWSLTPNVEQYRTGPVALLSAAWTGFLLITAAVGWWFRRRAVRSWILLLLPVVGFTLLHTIFVGSVRYRIPIMPMMMVLSATGIVDLVGYMSSRQSRK
jgi:hypothetical protein